LIAGPRVRAPMLLAFGRSAPHRSSRFPSAILKLMPECFGRHPRPREQEVHFGNRRAPVAPKISGPRLPIPGTVTAIPDASGISRLREHLGRQDQGGQPYKFSGSRSTFANPPAMLLLPYRRSICEPRIGSYEITDYRTPPCPRGSLIHINVSSC